LPVAAGQGPSEISIDEFDRISEEILFKKLCTDAFSPLFSYPEKKINVSQIDEYWDSVPI